MQKYVLELLIFIKIQRISEHEENWLPLWAHNTQLEEEYRENNVGPRTEPCGTPKNKFEAEDNDVLIFTACVLSER